MLLCALLACCQYTHKVCGYSRVAAARAQIENFKAALNVYRQDVGDYPSTEEGLQALRVSPGHPGWHGPYIPQDIPRDPWDKPFRYVDESGKLQITASHMR